MVKNMMTVKNDPDNENCFRIHIYKLSCIKYRLSFVRHLDWFQSEITEEHFKLFTIASSEPLFMRSIDSPYFQGSLFNGKEFKTWKSNLGPLSDWNFQ